MACKLKAESCRDGRCSWDRCAGFRASLSALGSVRSNHAVHRVLEITWVGDVIRVRVQFS